MMSVANCGMQDEKAHENEAGGNVEKRGTHSRPLSRTNANRMKKAP